MIGFLLQQEDDQWEEIDQDLADAVGPKKNVSVQEGRSQNPEKDLKQSASLKTNFNMEMDSENIPRPKPRALDMSINTSIDSQPTVIATKSLSSHKVGQTEREQSFEVLSTLILF
jgi:hypothetical protein